MLYLPGMKSVQSLFILGRQPALGLAELESLYGAAALQAVGYTAALLDVDPEQVDFARLGGSTRLAKVLTTLDTTEWRDVEKYLVQTTPQQADMLSEGKLTIGISTYGLKASPAAISATGLSIKKAIRSASGRSVRLVPNKDKELNTAQVEHNNLTGGNGWELLLIRDGSRTILAQTVAVQDIASYTIRDRERPKRDARVGMLPPKLAQIIINLAVDRNPPSGDFNVLDPFCGTGVVLQEAALMGFMVYGTDLEPRMVEYSLANMEWLNRSYENIAGYEVGPGDATTTKWRTSELSTRPALRIDAVACETYLGRPFTSQPPHDVLRQTITECDTIISKFLRNIKSQIKPGTRLCLAVPAWQVGHDQFKHLPLLDSLEEMGYNRISFEHVQSRDLLYYRADQIVARELLVLVKK